jgi:hypothetical protein
MKNWEMNCTELFSKEDIQRPKHGKECSISLTIKEMENKFTLRFYLTPFTMATI